MKHSRNFSKNRPSMNDFRKSTDATRFSPHSFFFFFHRTASARDATRFGVGWERKNVRDFADFRGSGAPGQFQKLRPLINRALPRCEDTRSQTRRKVQSSGSYLSSEVHLSLRNCTCSKLLKLAKKNILYRENVQIFTVQGVSDSE